MLDETWVVTPNIVNEAHIGASYNRQAYINQGDTWERSTEGFTFQRVFNNSGQWVNGIPDVSVTGLAGWTGPSHTLYSPTTEIEGGDTVSIVHGQHTMHTGVLIIRNRKNQNGRSDYDGNFSFNPSGNPNTTGYALADALLGNFNTYTEAQYDPIGYYRYWEPAAFFDDDWKVTRNLSINFGVRYELYQTMYSQLDNLTNFVPSLYNPAQAVKVDSKGKIVPGSGNIYDGLQRVANGVPSQYNYLVPNAGTPAVLAVPDGGPRGMYPSHNTWAPRVGFAYAVNEKTVVRGGFGIFYDRIQGNPTFYTLNNPPYVSSTSYNYGNISNISGGKTSAPAPFGTLQVVQPNLKLPYSEQFSLGVQRELPDHLFLEADYIGSLGRHLLVEPDMNQPPFSVVGAVASTTNENSIRPFAGYSTIQQFESAATSNYHSLQLQLSRRVGAIMFTAAYTYSKALGNSPSDTTKDHDYYNLYWMYGPLSYDATHVFSGSFIWYLPKLTSQPIYLRAPFGNWQSVARFFPIKERMSLQFRADFINAFNNVNFEGPQANRSNSAFGTIGSAYPPRNIQFGMKFLF
jgi:hypothetical protein